MRREERDLEKMDINVSSYNIICSGDSDTILVRRFSNKKINNMSSKVEFIESVCDNALREVEILVRVPYDGELTDAYASAIYDENGMRSMRVVTYEDYRTIYEDGSTGVLTKEIDGEYVEQIENLLLEEI